MSEHIISYCRLCSRPIILCGRCGNSTCNGMYGEDGKCPECPGLNELCHEWKIYEHFEDWLDINGANPQTNPFNSFNGIRRETQ